MILIGIIILIIGIALMRFLSPKEDVKLIQLELWPKIIAALITIGGLVVFIIGIILYLI